MERRLGRLLGFDPGDGRPVYNGFCPGPAGPYNGRLLQADYGDGLPVYGVVPCSPGSSSSSGGGVRVVADGVGGGGSSGSSSSVGPGYLRMARLALGHAPDDGLPVYAAENPCCEFSSSSASASIASDSSSSSGSSSSSSSSSSAGSSRSSSGSGQPSSGSAARRYVSLVCCDNPIPEDLTVTTSFAGAATCPVVGVGALVYDPASAPIAPTWRGTVTTCCCVFTVEMTCLFIPQQFAFEYTAVDDLSASQECCWATADPGSVSSSCSPFTMTAQYAGAFANNASCCNGTGSANGTLIFTVTP